jgi:pimeloyl-ACP methyl ester carboxylesterase
LRWYRANHSPAAIASTRIRHGACPLLAMPVMGVWPSSDGVLAEAQMTASAGFVADLRLWRYERLEGAGHWAQRDAPNELNKLLLSFLGQDFGDAAKQDNGAQVQQQRRQERSRL